jgi:hypothetical protein
MKKLILSALAGAVIVATGCVRTVNDTHTGAIWFGRDTFEQRYPRSGDQVYAAAVAVVSRDGALVSEFIPHDITNTVRSLEARVNNRKVWIRVESVSSNPEVADIYVQARTLHDTADVVLANQLSTEIALELTRVR